jgi:hypothetical protein
MPCATSKELNTKENDEATSFLLPCAFSKGVATSELKVLTTCEPFLRLPGLIS